MQLRKVGLEFRPQCPGHCWAGACALASSEHGQQHSGGGCGRGNTSRPQLSSASQAGDSFMGCHLGPQTHSCLRPSWYARLPVVAGQEVFRALCEPRGILWAGGDRDPEPETLRSGEGKSGLRGRGWGPGLLGSCLPGWLLPAWLTLSRPTRYHDLPPDHRVAHAGP